MLNYLKRSYRLAQFEPTWLSYFTNPYCIARNELYRAMFSIKDRKADRILDIGCGSKPYETLFTFQDYIGVEYDSERSRAHSRADTFYDGKILPFNDQAFDLIICNQVLEHIFKPDSFMSEIARVMRPGGRLILTVPFVWDEHEQPHDFGRYTSFGIKYLIENHGFQLVESKKLGAGFKCIVQLLTGHILKICPGFRYFINMITAPINILGLLISKLIPENQELFLDNFVIAKKI